MNRRWSSIVLVALSVSLGIAALLLYRHENESARGGFGVLSDDGTAIDLYGSDRSPDHRASTLTAAAAIVCVIIASTTRRWSMRQRP